MIPALPTFDNEVVDEPLKQFKSKLSSKAQVFTPKDGSAYDKERKVYNADINNFPRYIVKVGGVSDVIESVKFGAEQKIRVAMRCGGHSIRGDCVPQDGLLICGSLLRNCRVDPETKTATAEQGCLLKDIDHETRAFGLCVPGLGTASITGSFGLSLGGGQGWLNRKYGLACDNIIAADVVLADGSFIKCSKTQNEDLFWAICGGGGRYGVVTQLTYRCIETPQMNVSTLIWQFEEQRVTKILSEYINFCRSMPVEGAVISFLTCVPTPPTGVLSPTISIFFTHQGTVEEGKELLKPFLSAIGDEPSSNTTISMEYAKIQSMMDSPQPQGEPVYEKNCYIKKENVNEDLVKKVVNAFVSRPNDQIMIGLYNICCGGVVAQENISNAYPREFRKAEQVIIITSNLKENREKCIQWSKETITNIPIIGTYVNACVKDDNAEECFLENLKRLQEIKKKYDPYNVFGELANTK